MAAPSEFDFVEGAASLKRKQPEQTSRSTDAAQPGGNPHPNSVDVSAGGARGASANSAVARAAVVNGSQLNAHVEHGCHKVNYNAIIVSRRQQGNPLLKHIENVRWEFGDILPDYQLGATTCALFLSLRFHRLKPEYVHHRIKELQKSFRLRIILCHVDADDVVDSLSQVTRAALLNECTLFCAFSVQECARYLELFKSFETKPADAIQGRVEEDYVSRLNAALTTVRGVNRTDVLTLGRTFTSVAGIMQASMETMSTCPGIGPTKIRRLHEMLHMPFRTVVGQQAEITDAS